MDAANCGILSLVPAFGFLIFALATRKCICAVILSALSGYIIYYKGDFLQPCIDAFMDSTTDWDNNYIIVICLLFGCLVQLLRESKGALAIGEAAKKYVKSEKQALILTWLCGIVIFIDDYLSILVTANTVMPLTDQRKTPREMLCYIINTTSAPVCIIIPISAWVVFFSGVFEKEEAAKVLGSSGTEIYYSIMPYFFYPFLCVIFVPLVILGIIPKMGGIKKAYQRVADTGKLWPDSSAMMNADSSGEAMGAISDNKEYEEKEVKPHLWAFLAPMAVVIAVTIWQDILWGVVAGIAACFILFIPTRILRFGQFCDACYAGLVDMLYIAVILATSLFYRESMLLLGLPDYIIEVAGPFMSAHMLPATVFIVVALVCFATGSIWSIPAVTTPIVVPLAAAVGASLPLTLGALVSAAIMGAQGCFYSDVTLLSASATRVNNVDYAISQLPYILITTGVSFVAYVIAGFIMS